MPVLTLFSKLLPFETWHFYISNCDNCNSSLMRNIWWLIHSILGHSPTCYALSPCPLGPFGSSVSFTRPVPSSWKCSCFMPLDSAYAFFRFQTLPDLPLPYPVSCYSLFDLHLYFMAFIYTFEFIYLHNYLNRLLSSHIGYKPHGCRTSLPGVVSAE